MRQYSGAGKCGQPVSYTHLVDHILNRENARVLEPYGVTVYQAMSLIYVADHEGERTVNQRAIERFTQLSNPGVTKLIRCV